MNPLTSLFNIFFQKQKEILRKNQNLYVENTLNMRRSPWNFSVCCPQNFIDKARAVWLANWKQNRQKCKLEGWLFPPFLKYTQGLQHLQIQNELSGDGFVALITERISTQYIELSNLIKPQKSSRIYPLSKTWHRSCIPQATLEDGKPWSPRPSLICDLFTAFPPSY